MTLTNEECNKRVEELFDRNKNLFLAKRIEYAKFNDPLKNFEDAANMSGALPEEVLWFWCLKHIVSVKDIIFNKRLNHVTKELLEEKTGDIINYMILLNLIRDDKDKESK